MVILFLDKKYANLVNKKRCAEISNQINLKKFNSKIDIVKLNPKHYLDKIFTLRNFFKKNLAKGYPLMWRIANLILNKK